MDTNEQLTRALRAFEQVTGLEAGQMVEAGEVAVRLGAAAPMRVRRAGVVTPASLERALAGYQSDELLLADRVTPRAAEMLRERGVAFLDPAGNVFVQAPSTFVYVCGRTAATRRRAGTGAQAFRPKGLRVVFALLCSPDGLDASYRDLARDAGVALGTVTGVMRDLERLGYIRQRGRARRWENRAGLQRDWARAFPRELRPRLDVRRYRVDNPGWWRDVDPRDYGYRLGGEAGAAWLTGYLEPSGAMLYGMGDFRSLAGLIRPVRDDDGNLEVLEPFWSFEPEPDSGPVVPPLLIYADLLASPADRVQEVAGMVRERFLD